MAPLTDFSLARLLYFYFSLHTIETDFHFPRPTQAHSVETKFTYGPVLVIGTSRAEAPVKEK